MSSAVQCPSCQQRINVSPEMYGQHIVCPMCKSSLELGGQAPPKAQGASYSSPPVQPYAQPSNELYSPQTNSGSSPLLWIFGILGGGCLLTIVAVVLLGFLVGRAVRTNIQAIEERAAAGRVDFADARAQLQTVIVDKQNDNEAVPDPPQELFDVVKFESPLGKMSAYLSKPDDPTKKHPAIIWKFGGFGNGIGETAWERQPIHNDQSASVFRENGIVMMYPALRGGNDNPGFNECFFGEVDDILAAADFLAKQEFVDPDRIYLGGHSTGGTLVLLCAAASSQFRASFAFGPVDDISGYGPDSLPFDLTNRQELRLRNPVNWLHSIKNPTFAIEGSNGNAYSLTMLRSSRSNPNLHILEVPRADHFSVLGPVNKLLAQKIVEDTGDTCNITLSRNELQKLFD